MQVIPVVSLPNSKIPIHDRVIDALQRAQISTEHEGDIIDLMDAANGTSTDGTDYGNYNNLSAMANNYSMASKQQ